MSRRVRTQTGIKHKRKTGAKTKRSTKRDAIVADKMDDPEIIYVAAWPPINLKELAEKTGGSYQALRDRCKKEGWVAKRETFQAKVSQEALDALAHTARSKIVEANKRHIKIGQVGQGLGARLYRRADEMLSQPDAELKIGEAARAGTQAIKAGVDVERRGLGLADTVMYIQNVEEFASTVIVVLQQELGGHPDLLDNTVGGIRKVLEDARAQAGKVIEASYTNED